MIGGGFHLPAPPSPVPDPSPRVPAHRRAGLAAPPAGSRGADGSGHSIGAVLARGANRAGGTLKKPRKGSGHSRDGAATPRRGTGPGVPPFPLFSPKFQDLPWVRRDPRAQQRPGLQKDPGEDGRVKDLGCHRSCGIWGLWEAVIPNPGTYRGPGQPLEPREAPVPLQAALAGLARLAFVTARSLGTLQGDTAGQERGRSQSGTLNRHPKSRSSEFRVGITHRHPPSASGAGGTHGTLSTLREKGEESKPAGRGCEVWEYGIWDLV